MPFNKLRIYIWNFFVVCDSKGGSKPSDWWDSNLGNGSSVWLWQKLEPGSWYRSGELLLWYSNILKQYSSASNVSCLNSNSSSIFSEAFFKSLVRFSRENKNSKHSTSFSDWRRLCARDRILRDRRCWDGGWKGAGRWDLGLQSSHRRHYPQTLPRRAIQQPCSSGACSFFQRWDVTGLGTTLFVPYNPRQNSMIDNRRTFRIDRLKRRRHLAGQQIWFLVEHETMIFRWKCM